MPHLPPTAKGRGGNCVLSSLSASWSVASSADRRKESAVRVLSPRLYQQRPMSWTKAPRFRWQPPSSRPRGAPAGDHPPTARRRRSQPTATSSAAHHTGSGERNRDPCPLPSTCGNACRRRTKESRRWQRPPAAADTGAARSGTPRRDGHPPDGHVAPRPATVRPTPTAHRANRPPLCPPPITKAPEEATEIGVRSSWQYVSACRPTLAVQRLPSNACRLSHDSISSCHRHRSNNWQWHKSIAEAVLLPRLPRPATAGQASRTVPALIAASSFPAASVDVDGVGAASLRLSRNSLRS